MKCFLCENTEPNRGQLLCKECFQGIQTDPDQKKAYTKKQGKRKRLLNKYRNQLLAKPTPSQKKATKYTHKVAGFFSLGVVPERIFGPYIIDIYIPRMKIGLEIDGGIHSRQLAYDDRRDSYLKDFGVTIIRFTNEEVKSRFFHRSVWHIFHKYYIHDRYNFILEKAKENNVILGAM